MESIEHLEFLSKLKFNDDERANFEKEFADIIAFVDEIKQIDLAGDLDKDEPVGLEELRADEPEASMDREEVLANAPKQKDGCYVTPLVIE